MSMSRVEEQIRIYLTYIRYIWKKNSIGEIHTTGAEIRWIETLCKRSDKLNRVSPNLL